MIDFRVLPTLHFLRKSKKKNQFLVVVFFLLFIKKKCLKIQPGKN